MLGFNPDSSDSLSDSLSDLAGELIKLVIRAPAPLKPRILSAAFKMLAQAFASAGTALVQALQAQPSYIWTPSFLSSAWQ